MKFCFGVILLLLSAFSHSANMKAITGTINKVQLMGKNYASYSTTGEAIVFIHMDALPDACGSANFKRVAITSNHPAFNVVVSAALAAKAANQTVQLFYLEECTLWDNNAWDFAIFNTI